MPDPTPQKIDPQELTGGSNLNKIRVDVDSLFEDVLKLAAESKKSIRDTKELREGMRWTQTLTYLGFLLILAAFIAIVIDVWNNKGSSIQTLSAQINQQTIQLNTLNDELNGLNTHKAKQP